MFYRGDKVLVLVLVRVIKSLVHEKKTAQCDFKLLRNSLTKYIDRLKQLTNIEVVSGATSLVISLALHQLDSLQNRNK